MASRFKKQPSEGFTLLEVVIAIVLFSVVLLAASNLLISLGNFSSNFVRSESSLTGTALGAFEEITSRIEAANEVTIPSASFAAPSIDVNISPAGPASFDHTKDSTYIYWQVGTQLMRRSHVWDSATAAWTTSADSVIADNIQANSLSFTRGDATHQNQITVSMDAETHSGPGGNVNRDVTREHLETTAIMRSRSAN